MICHELRNSDDGTKNIGNNHSRKKKEIIIKKDSNAQEGQVKEKASISVLFIPFRQRRQRRALSRPIAGQVKTRNAAID